MRSNQLSYRAIAAPKVSSLICECKGKAFSFTHQTFRRKNRSAKKDRPTARNRQPPASPIGQAKTDRRRTDATVRQPNHQNGLPTAAMLCRGDTCVARTTPARLDIQRPLSLASIARFGQMRPSTGRHKCRPYLPGAAASRAVGTSRRLVRTISRAGSPRPRHGKGRARNLTSGPGLTE